MTNKALQAIYLLVALLLGTILHTNNAAAQPVSTECRAEILRQTDFDWGTPMFDPGDLPPTVCCATAPGNFYAQGEVYASEIFRRWSADDPRICNSSAQRHRIAEDLAGPWGPEYFDSLINGAAIFQNWVHTWVSNGYGEYNAYVWSGGQLEENHLWEFACGPNGQIRVALVYCPCGTENDACNSRSSSLSVAPPVQATPATPIQPGQLVPQGQPIPQGGLRQTD